MVENRIGGVIFCLYDGENIQLEKRLKEKQGLQNFIIIPGGEIEAGEDEVTALKREIKEEYGIETITFFKKLGVAAGTGNVYLVTNWVGDPKAPEADLGKSVHMEATLEDARILCKHPVTQEILDLLDKELAGNY
jgi:8-oxo-dGTP pyrophosphatase MutT (NUDIX family)